MAEKEKKTKVEEEVEKITEDALVKENENLIKEIESLKSQVDEYKDKWLRNVAEFDNYKKRNVKIWQDAFNEGVNDVVVKVLPIGDNLDWALTLGLDEKTAEGLKNVKRKFNDTLLGIGVEEINPEGQPFDPNVAEAVMQVEGGEGEQSDYVKQVFQKGYKIKDKIIRYAKVSVIK